MQEKEAFEAVVKILTPFARNAEALKNISMDTRVIEDLQINSARLVDIVIAFEDRFNVEIPDEAAETVRTVGDIVRVICAKSNEAGFGR